HRAVAAGRAPPADARYEGPVLPAAPLPDRVRERSARASAIPRIVGQPEGEAAEGRIAGAGVVLAHVPQRGPTGAGLDRPEQCGELRDGQLAHQRRRGLDVDHDPLTREQGPSRFRDRGGEPGRLLLWGAAGGEVVRDPHAKAHGANGRPVGDEEWIAVAPPLGGLRRYQLDARHTTDGAPIDRAIPVGDVDPVETRQPAPLASATSSRWTALVRTRDDVK